jgi:Zn-dependent metalloprotease
MKTTFNQLFVIFLTVCMAASIVGADEGQEKASVLQQAQIRFEKDGKSPTEIKFSEGSQPKVAAFFDEYKQYFGISDENKIQLYHSSQNEIGSHHRYLQHYKGIPIIGAEYILHEKNGAVWHANGLLVHGLKMDVTPALSEQAALQAALNHLGAEAYMWQNEANEAFLKRERGDAKATFYPKGELKLTSGKSEMAAENFKLVYRFDIYAEKPLGRYYVDVDAKTGEIVNKITRIHDADVNGSGASLYNGTVSMIVDQVSASNFRLQENQNLVRGADIRTYNMNNGTNYNAATDFTSTTANGPWDNAGVSAHWGAEATYDYYYQKHNRNSIDNAGFALLSYVHANLVGMGYPNNVNAFWDGSRMTYGDGDGVNYFPLVCLDVVGHELTHGVTDYSSNLIYSNESGALNESFSDIFGNAVEFFKENPGVESGFPNARWRVGEDLTANGLGIRNMANPNEFSDPDTYQGSFWYTGTADNGGVHTNSGVQNFWFYLLVEGGSGTNDVGYAYNVVGLGLTDAAAIAYTNNNSFLTSSSNYNAARNGAIAAAEQLFGVGSQQALSTAEAWLAVGVGTIPQPPADYATLPYSTGFETGSLDNHWNTYKSNSAGRIQVTSANGPYAGSYHLTMDVTTSNVYSQNEAWLHLNLAGETQVTLAFQWKEFGDETHTQDGVYFSNNGGASFVKVQSLSGSSTTWNSYNLDLDALAAANGLSLSSTFIVKFQQYDNYPIATDGFAFDAISVTGGAGGGWQTITYDDFEGGMGTYTDGGGDMSRYTGGSTNAHQGVAAADIQDNSGAASSFYHTASYNVTAYTTLEVDFWFRMVSMETNEDFWVQYSSNGGSTWQTVATFAQGTGSYVNNTFYHAVVTLTPGTVTFSSTAKLRFICDASANDDDVYIDEIEFRGTTAGSLAEGDNSFVASETLPTSFELKQNYPNPFNPTTTIVFSLPHESNVSIKIYNISGSLVKTLVKDNRPAGVYNVAWNGDNEDGLRVSSGVYIYRIEAGSFTQTRRMVMLK